MNLQDKYKTNMYKNNSFYVFFGNEEILQSESRMAIATVGYKN
jgi:hypothetical protein